MPRDRNTAREIADIFATVVLAHLENLATALQLGAQARLSIVIALVAIRLTDLLGRAG